MSIFVATLIRGGANAQQLGEIVVANLFCAILMRQDYVINAFFNVFCAVPTSCVPFPLAIHDVLTWMGLDGLWRYAGSALGYIISVDYTRDVLYPASSGSFFLLYKPPKR